MADAPWRCSQCGTVNEPAANACRTCGRWPSLFELEGSAIETEPRVAEPAELYEPQMAQAEYVEPEIYDVGVPSELDPDVDEEVEPSKPLWQRLTSLIVPIGIVLYIVVSALADR